MPGFFWAKFFMRKDEFNKEFQLSLSCLLCKHPIITTLETRSKLTLSMELGLFKCFCKITCYHSFIYFIVDKMITFIYKYFTGTEQLFFYQSSNCLYSLCQQGVLIRTSCHQAAIRESIHPGVCPS